MIYFLSIHGAILGSISSGARLFRNPAPRNLHLDSRNLVPSRQFHQVITGFNSSSELIG
jgi:hypothetical protein